MHSSSLPSRYGVYGVSSSERNVVGLRSREISRDFWRATDVQECVGRITLFGYSIMRCTRFKREVVESEIFRVEVTMQMIHGEINLKTWNCKIYSAVCGTAINSSFRCIDMTNIWNLFFVLVSLEKLLTREHYLCD